MHTVSHLTRVLCKLRVTCSCICQNSLQDLPHYVESIRNSDEQEVIVFASFVFAAGKSRAVRSQSVHTFYVLPLLCRWYTEAYFISMTEFQLKANLEKDRAERAARDEMIAKQVRAPKVFVFRSMSGAASNVYPLSFLFRP
jgi:hypothetical protein